MLESIGTEMHNETCKNTGTKIIQSRKQGRLNNMLFNYTEITLYNTLFRLFFPISIFITLRNLFFQSFL